MPIELRVPTPEDLPAMFAADARAFGSSVDDAWVARQAPLIDPQRFVVAVDRGAIVAINGSYAFDLTVPGGTTIPVGGITWVSVAATHRRRGLMRSTIEFAHRQIAERGEPVSILTSSEGGIYRRFGYGVATRHWEWTLDLSASGIRADLPGDDGSVKYLAGEEAHAHLRAIWERYRRIRPGELSRSEPWWQSLESVFDRPAGEDSTSYYLAHPDGCLRYRVAQNWNRGLPRHGVKVLDCATLTPEAHLALWRTLVNLDLAGSITGSLVLADDDPLPDLLTDPRALRTDSLADGLWVRVAEPDIAFSARRYGLEASVVVEADGRRWAIEGGLDGAVCRRTRARADVITDAAGLGSLLLGGTRLGRLVAARYAEVRSPEAGRIADRFFLADLSPNCQTHF